MGERTEQFIANRRVEKNTIWKFIQAGWLKNAGYVGKIIAAIAKGRDEAVVQALVEDGMLECDVMLPVALYAQLLWTPEVDVQELLQNVSLWPCVHFGQV